MLEYSLWVLGAVLVAVYFGAQAWGESDRQRGIAEFTQASAPAPEPPAADAPTAVLRVPGAGIEVPVYHGTSERTLRRGAGAIEGTAAPGSDGNVAIAAHRDTFFRGLQHVAVGDLIELETATGQRTYRISDLSIVEPTEVSVLAEVGEPVVTLVTCYPFYFVGNAPQRYIVRAVAAE